MKKFTSAISILILVCLLAGMLSGCGGSGKTEETAAPEFVWVPEFSPMPKDIGYINSACFSGDTLYAAGMSGDAEMSGTDGVTANFVVSADETGKVEGPVIYKIAKDASSFTTLPEYSFSALPEGSQGSAGVDRICAAPDGTLWVYESAYCYHYDLPEGFVGSDSDKEKFYVDDGMKASLRHLSSDGAELAAADLSELSSGAYLYVSGLVCDSEGKVYICSDRNISCFDENAQNLFTLDAGCLPIGLALTRDGNVFIAGYSEDYSSIKVRSVDSEKQSFTDITELVNNIGFVYSGFGENLFMYSTGSALYGYNKESGQSSRILDWIDCDIDSSALRAVLALDGDNILCADYSADSKEGEMALISKRSAQSVEEKTVLSLATVYLDPQLTKQVLAFNKRSDAYRISIKDYSQYNSSGAPTAGLTKLNTEMMAGDYPDILDVSQLPVNQYVSKGMLENLYTYMDADAKISRDDFIPSILSAMESGDGLYRASSTFYVLTVIGNSKVVGEEMGWNFDQVQECLATMPEGAELFQLGFNRSDFLRLMCYTYMDRLVDWESGECHFDGGDFREILQLCSLIKDTGDISADEYESDGSRVLSGKQMLELVTASTFSDYQIYSAMFGGDISFKGFPVSEGVGNFALFTSGLAITSKCTDKDGAWSFVRTLLTEDYQKGDNIWSFPTNQKAFDTKLAKAMEKTYTTDANGNKVEESTGSIGWDDFFVDLYAITPEQAESIKALIASADTAITYDDNITNIVVDAASSYFAGDQSLDSVIDNVQSRVSLYVNEQR